MAARFRSGVARLSQTRGRAGSGSTLGSPGPKRKGGRQRRGGSAAASGAPASSYPRLESLYAAPPLFRSAIKATATGGVEEPALGGTTTPSEGEVEAQHKLLIWMAGAGTPTKAKGGGTGSRFSPPSGGGGRRRSVVSRLLGRKRGSDAHWEGHDPLGGSPSPIAYGARASQQ